jgi:hypothetical protein
MEVRSLEMTAVTSPFLVEVHSRVVADNKMIRASYENVYEMLYGEEQ